MFVVFIMLYVYVLLLLFMLVLLLLLVLILLLLLLLLVLLLLLCRYTPLIDNIYWLIYFFLSIIFLIVVNIYCCDLIYSNYGIISLFIYFDAITCYIYDSLYVVYIISNEWG